MMAIFSSVSAVWDTGYSLFLGFFLFFHKCFYMALGSSLVLYHKVPWKFPTSTSIND